MSERLKQKMISYEVTVPEAAWEAVAARLEDDRQYAGIVSKIQNLESSPPAPVWSHISVTLDQPASAAVPVKFIQKLRRFASAAAIAGIVFTITGLAFHYLQKDDLANNLTAIAIPANVAPDSPLSHNSKPALPSMQAVPAVMAGKIPTASLPAYPNIDLPQWQPVSPIAVMGNNEKVDVGNAADATDIHKHYLTIAGPDGQLTRISTKFSAMVRLLDGGNEVTIAADPDLAQQDLLEWKKRLQEWRNKISRSAYTPSAVNFMDIVELKNLLQENQ